jgi:hypothetical protein
LDYAEHATVLALAGVLAASRGPGCRILRGLAARSGYISDWSPRWFPRTTPAHGVVSAARLQFWSASVSALRPGAALNVK